MQHESKKNIKLSDALDKKNDVTVSGVVNATNGEKIRALRKAKHISGVELARQVSLSDRAIRFIEKGERKPSEYTLQKIADVLGVPVEYFTDETIPKKELDNVHFYEMIREKYGSSGAVQGEKILEQTVSLLEKDEMSEEELAEFIQKMENLLSDGKKKINSKGN